MVRLNDREATRVIALAVIAVLCLLPSLVRLALPTAREAPRPICRAEVGRVDGAVVCRAATPLAPVEGLWAGRKIDLADATVDSLELVPGIGAKLAQRIVDDRAARGPFTSVADLARVKGIGPKLSARAGAFFTVRAE